MSTDLPHGDVVDADEADVLLLLLLTCWGLTSSHCSKWLPCALYWLSLISVTVKPMHHIQAESNSTGPRTLLLKRWWWW